MYCVNCGVKLADTEAVCPLCGVAAWHPEQVPGRGEPMFPGNRYPAQTVSTKWAQIILTAIFLMPMLITLLCDIQINGGVTWSGYVVGGLVIAYVAFVLPFWFRRPNPVIFVPCNFVTVGLFLLYINLATGGDWFLSFAFPVVGFGGAVVTTLVTLLRYVRRGRFYMFGGALLALGLFMPLMEFLLVTTFEGVRFAGWSFYPMIGLVLPGVTLFFLSGSRKARETMEQKFFL